MLLHFRRGLFRKGSLASSSKAQPDGCVMSIYSHIAVACACTCKICLPQRTANALLCTCRTEVCANQIFAHCMLKTVFLALFTGWWLTGGVAVENGARCISYAFVPRLKIFCHVEKHACCYRSLFGCNLVVRNGEDKLGLGRTAAAMWLLALAGMVRGSTYFFARLR